MNNNSCPAIVGNPPRESPDALYDLDTQLAHAFGRRTRELIRDGREGATSARLAASYAFRAYPALRLDAEALPERRPEDERHHFASCLRGVLPYLVIGAIGEAIK